MGRRESTTQEQTGSWLYKDCLRRTWILINRITGKVKYQPPPFRFGDFPGLEPLVALALSDNGRGNFSVRGRRLYEQQ